MSDEGERLAVRKLAIEHHHVEAKQFVDWYDEMAKSRFANAFSYGRHKIDVLLDAVLKEQQPGARILDVGCGTGEYIRRANELGFVASGLEPADAMRTVAVNKNPGASIVSGAILFRGSEVSKRHEAQWHCGFFPARRPFAFDRLPL